MTTTKTTITRENEQTMIAANIPGTDDRIIYIENEDHYVATFDGMMIYNKSEMIEVYGIDFSASDLERVGCVA